MQPTNLKDPTFVEELRSLKADLQIVVAFRMLPEVVWQMPPLGTFNAHASLLPKYRGAAPINWAVINGDTETGMTTFFLKHEIDTGDIIQQVKIPIHETDNVEIVHDKLMLLSGQLVTETVDNIIAGTITSVPQDSIKDIEPTPAPKIFRDTCRINWNQPAKKVYDFIRGLSPYPAAWTTLNGKSVKIYEACIDTSHASTNEDMKPGTILTDHKSRLQVATANGRLDIKVMQLEGKKRMPVSDLLKGLKIEDDAFFC